MNKGCVLLLVLISLVALYVAPIMLANAAEGTWVQKAPMQVARASSGVVAVDGKVYAIGGSNNTGYTPASPTGVNEQYDPATDTWTYKASMPTSRYSFGVAACQGKVYCVGGAVYSTGGFPWVGINEAYDPATDTWQAKAPIPDGTEGVWTQANEAYGKIFVMGTANHSARTYAYDPTTDAWEAKASMPIPMNGYVSAALDDKVYFFSPTLTQIYDPKSDSWSTGTAEPQFPGQAGQPARDAWAAAATSGQMAPKRIFVLGSSYVFGGARCFNRVYDPKADSWAAGADVPTDRIDFGAAAVGDRLYVVGGCTMDQYGFVSRQFASNEQYTPAGYGTPDPAYQPPTATPSSSSTPSMAASPSPAPASTPTLTPTPTATLAPTGAPSTTPSVTPTATVPELPAWAALPLLLAVLAAVVVWRKRRLAGRL